MKRSSWIIQVSPKSNNPGIFIKDTQGKFERWKSRRSCGDEGRDWSDVATAKESQQLQEGGRGKEQNLLQNL